MADRRESLAEGMTITASVRARVLGMKLLRLDADVTVVPARTRRRPRTNGVVAELVDPPRSEVAQPTRTNGSNGSIGGGLDEAARALEAGAVQLHEARRGMP